MASSSKKSTTTLAALLLSLNLLFFATATIGGNSYNTPTVPSGGGGGSSSRGRCPVDALKLGVCANLLGNLLNLRIGRPPVEPCCSLIRGLVDLEAAVCLCTVIRANVLNLINLNVPLDLSLLLNVCQRNAPRGFVCP